MSDDIFLSSYESIEQFASNELYDDIVDLLHSDSEEDSTGLGHGSAPGRARNIDRGHVEGAKRLYQDYFSANSTYSAELFARRFRISLPVFKRIIVTLEDRERYFRQNKDCTGRLGLTAFQKGTAALRQLGYGISADAVDEYVRIGESTALEALKKFCASVIKHLGDEYLRAPTEDDLRKILARSERRGIPGCIESIDCAKWKWRNCRTAHHGQYTGKEGVPTVTTEAITDDSLWIWHIFSECQVVLMT